MQRILHAGCFRGRFHNGIFLASKMRPVVNPNINELSSVMRWVKGHSLWEKLQYYSVC